MWHVKRKTHHLLLFLFIQLNGISQVETVLQEGHLQPITALTSAGDFLITGSKDHSIRIWNEKTERLIRSLSFHNARIYGVDYAPANDWLLSASSDGNLVISNFSTGEKINEINQKLDNHSYLMDAFFVKNSSDVIFSTNANKAYRWHAETNKVQEIKKDYSAPINTNYAHTEWTPDYINYKSFRLIGKTNTDTIQYNFDKAYTFRFLEDGRHF